MPQAIQDLCTMVVPWGLPEYLILPMGLSLSTDVFQQMIADLLQDLEQVLVFIDDIIIVGTTTYDKHMKQIQEVMKRLKSKNLKVNINKSEWAREEVNYLGFLVGRNGIKPQPKKIEAIRKIKAPKIKENFKNLSV